MDRNTRNDSRLTWLIVGLAVGAAAMYVLDPVYGKRRRALMKDKLHSASVQSQKVVNAKMHDLSNRGQGLWVKAGQWLH
jgi:gas vesicle protein